VRVRSLRLLRFAAAAVLGATLFVGVLDFAAAQDPPSKEEQIQKIRRLSPEEKSRLKEALDRFRAMTPEQREALRKKAHEVGAERLGELAGRDFEKLEEKHAGLEREMNEIMRLLGGPERLASLTQEERAYVRMMALRGFQEHCRLRLLQTAGLEPAAFNGLTPAEKREWRRKGFDAAVDKLLEERTLDAQAAFRAMTPAEQRRERAKLFAEWRIRETPAFVKKFDNFRLQKLLDMTPADRAKLVANHVHWLQLTSLLASDGADRDTLKMLHALRADERARVALVYEQSRDLPPIDRRAKVVEKIRELYGSGTFDESRAQRPMFPRVREILRERRGADAQPATPTPTPK
jgi:hypothetical protein